MKLSNLPSHIRAEIIWSYLKDYSPAVRFAGSHKRNAYEDILEVGEDEEGLKIEIARQGLYDLLPEALFHPIDRFENLPANDYKEKLEEQIEKQQQEEANAREYFAKIDETVFRLEALLSELKQESYSGASVLCGIICDELPHRYSQNRFVKKMIEFLPSASRIRGNMDLIVLIVRKILSDEGLKAVVSTIQKEFKDNEPRYACGIEIDCRQAGEISRQAGESTEKREEVKDKTVYLGNSFMEETTEYNMQYWSDAEASDTFPKFVEELQDFNDFINDFFLGIGTELKFNLTTQTLPTRISDDLYYNYLDYNTNL